MAKKIYEEASVLAIANAIRAKNGSTATYKVAQMADAVLAIAPLQPDVEEYPQMSTTAAAYLTAAEAAYTDANGGSVSVLDSYTGASGIKDAPLGKALTMQGGTRYQQDETTGIGGKLNNILGGESVIYNAVPGHVLRYIVKGSGGDVIDSGRVKPTGTVRMMKFIGYVKNCRDLGGWACDGGTVRYGRMYRCAAPGAAESADANIAQNANIRYHFDLRDNASLESSPFGSEVYYKRYPLSAYYSDLVDLTKSHYAEMAALLRAVFDVVIHGNGVIYHCSLGRDRTGTLSFILLALLGVSKKHVDMDYELSGFSSLSDAGTPQKRTSANYTGLANYFASFGKSSLRDNVVKWALKAGLTIDELNAYRSAAINGTPAALNASDYVTQYTLTQHLTDCTSNDFQSGNVEILPLQKKIDPAQVIVTANGQTISGMDELLDFGAYYRIVRCGKKDLSFRRSEVQLRQNCLTDGKNKEAFQYFKETAAAISLVAENGINILSMQYDKIQQVSEDAVLASYLAPQKEVKAPRMPETIIYPFGLNQSQKLAVERALSSKISIIQGPPGTGKTQTILNIIANVVRSGKTVAVVSNNNFATHNVAEKLEKKNAAFLTAFLGSLANKEKFLEAQTGVYPDMSDWEMQPEERQQLEQETTALSKELNEMLNAKNRIAEIEQEFLQLKPEQHYFTDYYATYRDAPSESLNKLSSQKILALWMEFEQYAEHETRLGLLQKLSIMFRFNRGALKLFLRSPELVIPYLQNQFYFVKKQELEDEKETLNRKLEHYAFDEKMDELTQKSLRLFRAELAARYPWKSGRKRFEKSDFRRDSAAFTNEYPVVLSTTYSIKGTLGIDHIYDYLIVDEASQVDLATGVLAFSCARNIVIVGDLKQLPNVLTENDIRTSDAIWQKYSLDERYRFSTHSLLSSALEIWRDAPVTLLREHYRCHPKIINFCNQKFYHGQLIVMTQDHNEPDVLTMYRTTAGNHARGHLNQRQIDVIQQEVLPRLRKENYQSIGIITPYRDQVAAIRKQLGDAYEVDTVHKFQGREQDAIILTSVDNVITDFVDDPHMLNVAVSRAVHSLAVVTSQDPRNDRTNYGDLTRYIEYNNFEVIRSQVYSVFDMLYQGYAEQRRAYLQKHKRVSEYDSENLMYSVIQEVLSEEAYSAIGCAVHVSLATLVKDYEPLTEEECKYARNPLTHVDFLLFNQMDKQPVLTIEVDGTGFHEVGSKQAERDIKKNSILEKCAVPLLRLRTDGSGEKEKIKDMLKTAPQK